MTILCRSLAESSDSQSKDDTAREDEEQCLPVQCLGRQEGLNVFVMGPSLQFWSNGEVIPPDQQRYVTIKGTLKERPSCLWSLETTRKRAFLSSPCHKWFLYLFVVFLDEFPTSYLWS